MISVVDHPAIGKTYEIFIGGVAYPGQCRRVWKSTYPGGRMVAECQYFNNSNPDATFKVEVDTNGNPV